VSTVYCICIQHLHLSARKYVLVYRLGLLLFCCNSSGGRQSSVEESGLFQRNLHWRKVVQVHSHIQGCVIFHDTAYFIRQPLSIDTECTTSTRSLTTCQWELNRHSHPRLLILKLHAHFSARHHSDAAFYIIGIMWSHHLFHTPYLFTAPLELRIVLAVTKIGIHSKTLAKAPDFAEIVAALTLQHYDMASSDFSKFIQSHIASQS